VGIAHRNGMSGRGREVCYAKPHSRCMNFVGIRGKGSAFPLRLTPCTLRPFVMKAKSYGWWAPGHLGGEIEALLR
jgi:hypothetical protein